MRLAGGEDLHHIPHGTLLGEPGMSRQRDHTPPTWACQMTTTIAATEWRPSATASFEAHVLVRRNSRPAFPRRRRDTASGFQDFLPPWIRSLPATAPPNEEGGSH